MRTLTVLSILIFILHALGSPGSAFGAGGRLWADGPELVLSPENGPHLRGRDLIGVKLVLAEHGSRTLVRIDGVETDETATGGPLLLYRVSVQSPDGQEIGPLCLPDPQGRRAGIAMPDGSGGFRFTCTGGAEGKCVRMGYRPWESSRAAPLQDLHRACVHMLRADYGGDDRPTTRDGTSVDIFDRFGIQKSEKADGMQFEAAWGPDGALCVAHPRIAQNVSLERLDELYPQLTERLGPERCDLERMQAEPQALLFNHSFP
jgi:hypothetical protein